MVAETMTVAEAIEKFSEIDQDYLIFKNIETDNINVIVKKDEEHFRIFEP
jgi:hypothetical protein